MRTRIIAFCSCLGLLSASTAWAQDEFATQGTFAVGAERLFGLTLSTDTVELDNGTTDTTTTTTFSLLGGGGAAAPSYHAIPRIGLDYFVIDGLSLGGSLMFITRSGETEVELPNGISATRDDPRVTFFMLSPRIGYAVMFNETVGIWPRGGITYYNANVETEDTVLGVTETTDTTDSGVALTLEMPLVLSPIPNVAFTITPAFDIPLSGTREIESSLPNVPTIKADHTIFDFGIYGGLLVWF